MRPDPIPTNERNPFANHTMRVRVPATLMGIIERNPDYSPLILDNLHHLRQQIIEDAPIPMLAETAPDYDYWLPQWQEHAGETWQNGEWFFAETYLYRQVIAATRWWETGRDPFRPNKDEEYASDALWALLAASLHYDGTFEERLAHALGWALWGNRIDLSYAESQQHGTDVNQGDLLVDDIEKAVTAIVNGAGPVHFIVDNAGTELTMDLVLVDLLLSAGIDVTVHLKLHPTFVSDATPADVRRFLVQLGERGGEYAAFGDRLMTAFTTGQLQLLPNRFWNSSYFLWQMPTAIRHTLAPARLVVLKGDANYRRMLGDAYWQADTPVQDAVNYLPAPLVALRTLKSDPIVGLAPGKADQLDAIDERWRWNGKRGVIQFVEPLKDNQ